MKRDRDVRSTCNNAISFIHDRLCHCEAVKRRYKTIQNEIEWQWRIVRKKNNSNNSMIESHELKKYVTGLFFALYLSHSSAIAQFSVHDSCGLCTVGWLLVCYLFCYVETVELAYRSINIINGFNEILRTNENAKYSFVAMYNSIQSIGINQNAKINVVVLFFSLPLCDAVSEYLFFKCACKKADPIFFFSLLLNEIRGRVLFFFLEWKTYADWDFFFVFFFFVHFSLVEGQKHDRLLRFNENIIGLEIWKVMNCRGRSHSKKQK